MRLLAQLHHLGEVLVVDVRVHAEQPLEDGLGHAQEVLGERDACGQTPAPFNLTIGFPRVPGEVEKSGDRLKANLF